MQLTIEPYHEKDLEGVRKIWNEITQQGNAFPGEALYSSEGMKEFLSGQTRVTCAKQGETVVGFYILHPNNIGRAGHIANASFGVAKGCRGMGIGEKLVRDCLAKAKLDGFRGLQFNAVVASNHSAISLYQKCGFTTVGIIPGGYRRGNGDYEDIYIMFYDLR